MSITKLLEQKKKHLKSLFTCTEIVITVLKCVPQSDRKLLRGNVDFFPPYFLFFWGCQNSFSYATKINSTIYTQYKKHWSRVETRGRRCEKDAYGLHHQWLSNHEQSPRSTNTPFTETIYISTWERHHRPGYSLLGKDVVWCTVMYQSI